MKVLSMHRGDYQVAITATTVRIKRIINAPGILKLKRFSFIIIDRLFQRFHLLRQLT